MKITGLLGCGISYSRSPEIHNEYYKLKGYSFKYSIFDIEKEELPNFIRKLNKNKVAGFNVTIPYKIEIMKYLNDVSKPALEIGAVNTVAVNKDKLLGYNTDYEGFIGSLKKNNICIKDMKVLILGSGGVARTVYKALTDLKVSYMHMAVRNVKGSLEKFTKIEKIMELSSIKFYNEYDIIINCTPLGGAKYKEINPLRKYNPKKDLILYDLNYGSFESELWKWTSENNVRLIKGDEMLKLQAYYAADIWNLFND